MKLTLFSFVLLSCVFSCCSATFADTFGSGANSFEIEFVPIYNPDGPAGQHGGGRLGGILPGNRPDNEWPGNIGSVPYFYRMGKFEISEQMIDKVNALTNSNFTHDNRGPDKPATSISWMGAARFVNWLNTSTGHSPAYKMFPRGMSLWQPGDLGYNPDNLFRNRFAKYFLPSADEWYKAAYYDPTTPTGTWYDYPTGSDTPPTPVAGGTDPGTAVYGQDLSAGPADIMNAGGLSPYGTMGQGGNVYEWEETEADLVNDNPFSRRGFRGGFWEHSSLSASSFGDGPPEVGVFGVGFRVASIPEPGGLILFIPVLLRFLLIRSLDKIGEKRGRGVIDYDSRPPFLARLMAPLATGIQSTGSLAKRFQMLQTSRVSRVSARGACAVAALVLVPLSLAFAEPGEGKPTDETTADTAPRITGQVTDQEGQPIADVLVRVAVPAEDMRFVNQGTYETKTGKEGRYEVVLQGLGIESTASIDAMAPGYRRMSDALRTSGGSIERKVSPGSTTDVFLTLEPSLYIKGIVTNEAGEPLANVNVGANAVTYRVIAGKERVSSSGGIERTASQEDGTFEVFNFPFEPQVRDDITEKGFIGFDYQDYVSAEVKDVYALTEEERTNLRIVLPTGRRVEGTLRDADGQPVANVMVEILDAKSRNRDKACLTDAEGKFALRGLIEQPVLVRAHAMDIRQKIAKPLSLDRDYDDFELRLEPITISEEPHSIEVLGMKLADFTPELRSRYDLHHEHGALILDPGTNSARLGIGELREGYSFWIVGQEGAGGVREFVQKLLEEAAKRKSDEDGVRVVYNYNASNLRIAGTNTQYIKLTEEDLRELRKVLAAP